MFNVSRPMDVVVLKDCVTDTNVTPFRSNTSTSFEKSISDRDRRSIFQTQRARLKRQVFGAS
ncbi:hypothetical protein ACSSV8_000577 [Roseovarius sp. MBR-79]|jgi:hypothetical protein